MPKKSDITESKDITKKSRTIDKSKSIKSEKEKIESKRLTKEEYEQKVLELANSGMTTEKIGENLRSQKIHPKEYKIKISKILKTNNLYIQPDIKNIQKKLEKLQTHALKNKQDKLSKREVVRVSAQLRKLKEVYKIA